jgi:hypothetical protein
MLRFGGAMQNAIMEVREDADLYGQILKVGITRDSNTNRC